MKENILYLVIGILIGAIIVTSVFIIYDKMSDNTMMKKPDIDDKINIYDEENKMLDKPEDMMPNELKNNQGNLKKIRNKNIEEHD